MKYKFLILAILQLVVVFSSFSQSTYIEDGNIIMIKSEPESTRKYQYLDSTGKISFYSLSCCDERYDYAYEYSIFNKKDTVTVHAIESQMTKKYLSKLDSIQQLPLDPYSLGGHKGSNQIFTVLPKLTKSIKINDSLYVLIGYSSDRISSIKTILIISITDNGVKILRSILFRLINWSSDKTNNYKIDFYINVSEKKIILGDKTNNISNNTLFVRDSEGLLTPIKAVLPKGFKLSKNDLKIIYKIKNKSFTSQLPINDNAYFIVNW